MSIRKTSKCFFLTALLCLSAGSGMIHAQDKDESRGIDRWALKTNVIDWAATIPNFSVEYDLSGADNNKMTLGLTARYNWNTHHTRLPYNVFNLMQIRPEYRYYWRSSETKRAQKREMSGKRTRNRHENRLNYAGAYMDAGMYSFKADQYGHQGQIYTVGLSMGYGMPKYQYRKGYIDMEVGFALGVALVTDNAFSLDSGANVYIPEPSVSKGLHIAPFPIVSSLNVSFAWRSKSIKDKHRFTDADRIRQQEREARRISRKEEQKLKKKNR